MKLMNFGNVARGLSFFLFLFYFCKSCYVGNKLELCLKRNQTRKKDYFLLITFFLCQVSNCYEFIPLCHG